VKPLSYAQNMEDYHLWQCFGGRSDGVYIDIGAGHPVADNVTFWLYERGWRGLVVEPQDSLAALYRHVRPRDTVVSALIGRASGTAAFHEVERLHGLSSLREDVAARASEHGAAYSTRQLPMMTLAELWTAHNLQAVDVLKIDVEGAEADVLAGNDWSRCRPSVIVAEAIAPGSNERSHAAWEPILTSAGYEFVLDDTLNRFYVAREATDVLARAPRERAPWDAVTHMYEIGRAPETALHPDHELSLALARGLWASLPLLEADLLADLLARGRGLTSDVEIARLAQDLRSEEGRARRARIACGYDGGQIFPESE
jgi:FkbM family methyltransferase